MSYAQNTTVSMDKSKAEIEQVLRRYGADQFYYGWADQEALARIAFRAHGRHIQFNLKMPDRNDPKIIRTPAHRRLRSPEAVEATWEQACRQRWRALALVIKAKLEAVESEITTFEDEFLAHTMLPEGMTVSSFIQPQIKMAYETGRMPTALIPYLEEQKPK
jgi:hypothetical protein